jgi:hypothetical protein
LAQPLIVIAPPSASAAARTLVIVVIVGLPRRPLIGADEAKLPDSPWHEPECVVGIRSGLELLS